MTHRQRFGARHSHSPRPVHACKSKPSAAVVDRCRPARLCSTVALPARNEDVEAVSAADVLPRKPDRRERRTCLDQAWGPYTRVHSCDLPVCLRHGLQEEHREHHEKRLRERAEFKEDRRQKRLEAKERAAMAIEDEISSQLDEAIAHMKRLYAQIAAAEAAAKKNARSWAVSPPRVAASQADGSSVGGSTATPKKRRPTNATVTSRAGATTRARRGTNTTAVSGAGSGVGAGAGSSQRGGRRRSSAANKGGAAERRRSNATRRRSNVSNAVSGT